jgi:adenylate cyclase
MDWDAEGLLEGLDDGAREGRRRLLDALHADGVPVEELRAAVEQDRLVLLPIERSLMAPPRHTLAEVAAEAGVPEELVALRFRAMGLTIPEDPGARAFGDDDLEAARRGRRYLDVGLDAEEGAAVLRGMSAAMARTADTLRRPFAATFLRAGDAEDELARRFSETADVLLPLVVEDLGHLLRHHLRDFVRSDALGAAERSSGKLPDAVEVAVAFADIVGFTALGQEVPETALTDIAQRLEGLALEHVGRPARVVKSIGDAVMVVSPEPAPLLDAMVDLVAAAAAADDFPPLRAGVAFGGAVGRLGDWFGQTVNLASRVCGRARPDSVLATNAVRDALGEDAARFAFTEAGLKHLKGYAKPVPVLRVRRASGSDG